MITLSPLPEKINVQLNYTRWDYTGIHGPHQYIYLRDPSHYNLWSRLSRYHKFKSKVGWHDLPFWYHTTLWNVPQWDNEGFLQAGQGMSDILDKRGREIIAASTKVAEQADEFPYWWLIAPEFLIPLPKSNEQADRDWKCKIHLAITWGAQLLHSHTRLAPWKLTAQKWRHLLFPLWYVLVGISIWTSTEVHHWSPC